MKRFTKILGWEQCDLIPLLKLGKINFVSTEN
jgi:hypothetical protein